MAYLSKLTVALVFTLVPLIVGYICMLGYHDLGLVGGIMVAHLKAYKVSIAIQSSIIYFLLD